MARVRLLPPAVANQIAAGEVVERPAAVVRELVENSIDAGAGKISIVSRKAGSGEIRVTDDGIGMTVEDARRALERHATSKIESVEDLRGIGSLGFRGEALPSIASVSRFRLRTRPHDCEAGWEISVEGGETVADRPAGTPPGTAVEVRDLFYNTPARRKFLRKDATETARIVAAVSLLAAAWPQVRFRLESNGRETLSVEPVEDLGARLRQLEPRWFREAIVGEDEVGHCSVRVFLSPPTLPRGASAGLRLFVNGRAVSDRRLFHAVTQAYREISSLSGTPKAYVFLEVPPEAVDVNVHPAKAEVRFAEPREIWRAVRSAVLGQLGASPKRVEPGAAGIGPAAFGADGFGSGAGSGAAGEVAGEGGVSLGAGFRETMADGRAAADLLYGGEAGVASDLGGTASRFSDFGEAAPTVIGQFRRTYVLAEDASGLLLVDQHAAEERVVFHRLMESGGAAEIALLLQPYPLELSAAERSEFEAVREQVEAAGFEIEPQSGGALLLRGVPAVLGLDAGISVLLRSLNPADGECTETAALDIRARTMARIACHASVTANTTLSRERMTELLRNLWVTPDPGTCPHGRPTVLRFDLPWVERRFGRR